MSSRADVASSRIPTLDGLRGIAILAVMIFHFRWIFARGSDSFSRFMFNSLGFGWVGVDLFFALSGFLITGILLDTRDSSSYFRAFYGRRCVRIFPLYYLIVAIVLGAAPFASRALGRFDFWQYINPLWYLTYTANWQPVSHGANDIALSHLWSLCIEEQFYIVWPALLWFTPRRWLSPLALLLAMAALAIRIGLLQTGFGHEAVYRLTIARMDGLALGSWIAIGLRCRDGQWLRTRARSLFLLGLAGFASIAVLGKGLEPSGSLMHTIGFSFLSMLFASLVYFAAHASGALSAFLTWRPLTTAGTFSYAMYVFHIPLDFVAQKRVDHIAGTLPLAAELLLRTFYVVAMVAIMFGIGWLSWNLFEKHLLKLKRHFPYHAPNFELPLSGATVMEPDKALRAAGSNRP